MAMNQTSMIGPKKAATSRRAARLHREQRDQDHHRQRHDIRSSAGVATLRPSTAESTEIAGVIIASP